MNVEASGRDTARSIIQSCSTASLGTLDADGFPFVSLVTITALDSTTLVTLISGLAKHTRHIKNDGRCSLLLADHSDAAADPLASARLTVVGRASVIPKEDDADARAMYLEQHPQAAMYADFGDFAFYRIEIREAHLVAGFGRIETLRADQL